MLRLTIIEEPDGEKPESATIIVGPGGATVGRTRENTWVLPDTQSLLSRSHFEILFENGAYVILDRSTNGTFVNEEKSPIGRGNKVPIQEGDLVRLGNYKIEVKLESVGVKPNPLLGSRPEFLSKGKADLAPPVDPLGPELDAPSAEFGDSSAIPDAFAAIQPQQVPADLFGGSPGPGASSLPSSDVSRGIEDKAGIRRDSNDDRLPTNAGRGVGLHSGTEPGAQQPAPRLFVPVVPAAGAEPSKVNARSVGESSGLKVDSPPVPPDVDKSGGVSIPDDWYLEPAESPPGALAPGQSSPVAPNPLVSPPVDPLPTPSSPRPAPAATAMPSSESSQLEQGIREAVSGALGRQAETMGRAELVRVVEEMSAIAQACAPGLMRAMNSRTQFKDHMRLDQTMVKAHDNNPLKFCSNPEDALSRMLLNDQPGLLQGRLAVAEAFRELATHQSALIAALQPALQETVQHFSPAAVEAAAKAEGGISFSLTSGKGKLWDTYEQIYAKLGESDRGRLEQSFMTSLAQHYERCLGSLG